jgi:acetoin utilization deacetylase AcuC-like enzyme
MTKRTAIVYDPYNRRHTREGHVENYRRLEETWKLLQIDGILPSLVHAPSTVAPLDAVLRVHTRAYLDRLESASLSGGGHLDADTYVTSDSYQVALLGAGGLLNLVDLVLRGEVGNGFALVRPPGHHALPHWGMGFCLLGNPAIAARWAQDRYGLQRILIVDFDVHHGNGTQDVFYRDPSVLYFSIHQYPFYPGTGAADETGLGQAEGATINIPFPAAVGDEGYLAAFRQILAPAARILRPELILVSAGFDAHWMDPLAHMRLTVTGYYQLVVELIALADELCQGRLVAVLEGGYRVNVLSHCVLSTLRALSGSRQGPSDPYGPAPGGERDVAALLERLKALHRLEDAPFRSLPG